LTSDQFVKKIFAGQLEKQFSSHQAGWWLTKTSVQSVQSVVFVVRVVVVTNVVVVH
jgi:hypothetical protein